MEDALGCHTRFCPVQIQYESSKVQYKLSSSLWRASVHTNGATSLNNRQTSR